MRRTYQRKPGGRRKPLPKEYGAASSVHEYFSAWAQAGLFMRLWQEGLLSYGELRGIGWEWHSADGCMAKAPLARESAGRNPADRGKKRDEAQPCGRVTRITDRYSHRRGQPA